MVILLMGVSGSGKTTIGEALAAELGCDFRDADSFHSAANIAKMTAGHPLDDHDRAPWLAAIRAYIDKELSAGHTTVVTCSALKQRYRDVLVGDRDQVRLVYLKGSPELLASRLKHRRGHFMKASMLASQLAALEEPKDAVVIDVSPKVPEIVAAIRRKLSI